LRRTHAASPGESPGLDQVIVTARRREERLLEVPDSITAFTAAAIEGSHIASVKDVAQRMSNFTIVEAQEPGVGQLNVRGVCQARNGEPPVALVIDGVQMSSSYQITQPLFDVERIEVVKGPQGAMYGRNASGGAINITTRAPSDELEGQVRAGVGSHSDYTGAASVSGPLIQDKLLFRLAADFRSFDGDIASPNKLGRSTANDEDNRNVRLRLLATPSERTTFDARVARLDTQSGAPWYTPVPPGESGDVPRAVQANFPTRSGRTSTEASLKSDVRFERTLLTSVSAFSRMAAGVDGDVDFTPADGSNGGQALHADAWSQEVRIASVRPGAFKWLAGVFYLNTHQHLDTQIYLRTDFLPLFGLPPQLSPFLISATRTTDNNDAYAGFGQVSYRWAPGLELTAAVRYDVDRRHQIDRSTPTPAIYQHTFDSVQPKVSLSWNLDADKMVYATAGKGFRSGGFNPQDRITRIYKAETDYSYEVGFKAALLDNRVNFTTAAFYTHIDDRQVYTLDIINSAQTLSNPVPKSEAHGLEFDLAARPVPALELGASLGLMRSKILRYDPTVFAGLPVAGDFTGNQLPLTPEISYSLYTQYRVSLQSGVSLTPRLELQGCGGDYFWEIDNANRRRPQNFVNLRLTAQRSAWSVSTFLENALDEQYVIEFLPAQWSGVAVGDLSAAGRGRHWGVEARYQF
jgi:iron complex outermembrane receptor protein